ncbi:MAG: signal peptidase I [Oscillospiraceae bacterium]|nr:signal peptidase I [Oscillospiraceae bacterium]
MNINSTTRSKSSSSIFNPVTYNEFILDQTSKQDVEQYDYNDAKSIAEDYFSEPLHEPSYEPVYEKESFLELNTVGQSTGYAEGVIEESNTMSPKMRLGLYDLLQSFVTAVICAILILTFVGRTTEVIGHSMLPTLRYNDHVIISNLFYSPRNGDIIVFETESERFDEPLVKRVIAIGGQSFDINDVGEVLVDGIVIDEPYIDVTKTLRNGFVGPVDIPYGYVFVLGDNRNRTADSRDEDIGLLDTRYILGRVLFITLPGLDSNGNRDWSNFGFVE